MENGKEKPVKKLIYDRNGIALFESKLVKIEIKIEPINNAEFVGDTVKLKIKIIQPIYEFTNAFVGNVDEYLNPLDSIPTKFFGGNPEHESIISVPLVKGGVNDIRGIIRDFTIKPINDSIGVTVANDTYFKFSVFAKRRKTK